MAQFPGRPATPTYTPRDVSKVFDVMSGGKPTIDLSKLPSFLRYRMQAYARSKGINDGQMTRKQFLTYMEEQKKRYSQPPSSSSSRRSRRDNDDDDDDRRDRSSNQMSRAEFFSRLKRETDSYFNDRDDNKDGYLDTSEMSSRLRERYGDYDINRDGKVSFTEVQNYIRSYLQRRYESRISHWKNAGYLDPTTTSVDPSILDQRPIVYRVGQLPEELHDSWFEEADQDADGQLGLYEWRSTEKDLEEFRDYDRNDDGFVTIAEMIYYKKYVEVPEITED